MRTPKQHPWDAQAARVLRLAGLPDPLPGKVGKAVGGVRGRRRRSPKDGSGLAGDAPLAGAWADHQEKHEQAEDFRRGFLALYRWDRRRFLRHMREKLGQAQDDVLLASHGEEGAGMTQRSHRSPARPAVRSGPLLPPHAGYAPAERRRRAFHRMPVLPDQKHGTYSDALREWRQKHGIKAPKAPKGGRHGRH